MSVSLPVQNQVVLADSDSFFSQFDSIEERPEILLIQDNTIFPIIPIIEAENQTVLAIMKVVATAYNNDPLQCDDTPDIMASGKTVYEGAIANNCLPFGTKVLIDGNYYTVEDRMNSKYSCDYIDIFMFSKSKALVFGQRKVEMKIIAE